MTCTPASESELLLAVNWAYQNKYKARPLGMQHNWSPLTIANSNDNSHVLLIDMKKSFANISITASADGGIVTAQTGVTMEKLLTELEKRNSVLLLFRHREILLLVAFWQLVVMVQPYLLPVKRCPGVQRLVR